MIIFKFWSINKAKSSRICDDFLHWTPLPVSFYRKTCIKSNWKSHNFSANKPNKFPDSQEIPPGLQIRNQLQLWLSLRVQPGLTSFRRWDQYQTLKKSRAKSDDPINFYGHKCVWNVPGMLLFGWLPWTLGESKHFFLSKNFLVISWAFIIHTQKNNFEKKIQSSTYSDFLEF